MKELTVKPSTVNCPEAITNALEDMLLEVASLEPLVLTIAASAANLSDPAVFVAPEHRH